MPINGVLRHVGDNSMTVWGGLRMGDVLGAATKTLDRALRAPLDADAVRHAYARWAERYDAWFGLISRAARQEAVAAAEWSRVRCRATSPSVAAE